MKVAFLSAVAMLAHLVTAAPVLSFDIHVSDDSRVSVAPCSGSLFKYDQTSKPVTSQAALIQEQIPGWVFIQGNELQARIHGNTFWNIKGELSESFPLEDFLFDPMIMTLETPEDFTGDFTGTIGRGQFKLDWKKTGASIVGRSPVGDFEIEGSSKVDYSP